MKLSFRRYSISLEQPATCTQSQTIGTSIRPLCNPDRIETATRSLSSVHIEPATPPL